MDTGDYHSKPVSQRTIVYTNILHHTCTHNKEVSMASLRGTKETNKRWGQLGGNGVQGVLSAHYMCVKMALM